MKAAVYLRVSTDEQAREGVSLDMQEGRCREAAIGAGATKIEVFTDAGFSGSSIKRRPAMQELLGRLGEFDVIVVWKLDRLSRSVRDWSNLMHKLGETNVGFLSVSERFDFSTPWGKAALNMLATFSELFLDILRSNVKASMQQIVEDGRWPGGVIMGYNAEDGLKVDPVEAELVREMFTRYADGDSVATIARDMNARGIPTKKGGRQWNPVNIRRILNNEEYLGRIRWRGEYVDGNHEAIIPKPLWDRAQKRYVLRKGNAGKKIGTYTQLLRCGVCGSWVGLRRITQYKETYACVSRGLMPVEQRHEAWSIGQAKLLAVIWRDVELLLTGNAIAEALEQRRAVLAEARGEQGAKRSRIREIERLLLANLEAFKRGALPGDMLEVANQPLIAERESLHNELARARPGPELAAWQKLAKSDAEKLIGNIRGNASIEEQVEFLKGIYSRIELFRNRAVFHYVADLLPPQERMTPKYYAPRRGHTELGF